MSQYLDFVTVCRATINVLNFIDKKSHKKKNENAKQNSQFSKTDHNDNKKRKIKN